MVKIKKPRKNIEMNLKNLSERRRKERKNLVAEKEIKKEGKEDLDPDHLMMKKIREKRKKKDKKRNKDKEKDRKRERDRSKDSKLDFCC